MSAKVVSLIETRLAAQPDDIRLLPDEERDRLIISSVEVDGNWVIKSQYGDGIWELSGGTTNSFGRCLDFSYVPLALAYSGPCRAAIPVHAGPVFRCMPGHHSGACRQGE